MHEQSKEVKREKIKEKLAILRRFVGKSQVPKLHTTGGKRPTKARQFGRFTFGKSTRHRAQNALGIINKILHKSMTAVRHQFNESFLKHIFKKIRTFIMSTTQQFESNDNAEHSTNHVTKPSIILIGLNLLHRFFCLCVRFILIKRHGEHGPSMPPIDDLLLLESATSIAEKIRTKKVSCHNALPINEKFQNGFSIIFHR